MNVATRVCIQNAHVTAPNTLPTHISPLNQPYSTHTRRRSSSSILHHRQNMVPPPTALTQNAAICARKRHHAHQQQQPQLTVTPQLAYAVSSSVCGDLFTAVAHASAQKEDDMMACKGSGGGGGGGGCKRNEGELKNDRQEDGWVTGL